jgi:transcriptional regulator of arginine metabolism
VVSQEDLVERLAAEGLRVTQATVSRDLNELGAFKMRKGGGLTYALPGETAGGDQHHDRLRKVLGDWLESAEAAGNLIVMRTPPGSAHVIANALDQAAWPEAAGTIAGDDTLMLIVRDGVDVQDVLGRLRSLAAH